LLLRRCGGNEDCERDKEEKAEPFGFHDPSLRL
jgi:hypothetical protein